MQLDIKAIGAELAAVIDDALEPLRQENAGLRKRLEAVESREPQKGEPGADGRDGADGKSVTVEDVTPLIADAVKVAVDAIPAPKDGKDGANGRDGDPVAVPDVVDALVKTNALQPVLDLLVTEALDAHIKSHPPKDGKDGDPGPRGEDGKSITLDDVSLFLDAAVAKHVLDFERRANETLAKAIDKIPAPKDGKDGADLTEVALDFDGERTVTIKGRTGEVSKRLPVPLWRGYWSPGIAAEKADILTHNGTAYIAIVDNPKCEPGVGKYDHEWKVFTRKGRDGKDGRNGIDKTASVKVKGDA